MTFETLEDLTFCEDMMVLVDSQEPEFLLGWPLVEAELIVFCSRRLWE